MGVILKTEIKGPEAWTGCNLLEDSSWVHHLTKYEINDLEKALARVQRKGHLDPDFDREAFDIGCLKNTLSRISTELESGKGFVLVKGLPVERYTELEIQIIYFGLGLHLGTPVLQNPKGDILGEVINVGDLSNKETRVYETNAHLPYHTDPSDVVGLLCLRNAKKGGLSSLVSAASIYNRILNDHPEYLGLFYKPYFYAHLGEDLPSLSPLFSYHDEKLSCRYLRQYIELGHEVRQHPLSSVEKEALDLFDSIANDPNLKLDMMLQPGDIQFVNNYSILHARSEFEDHDDLSQRRKLLRLWLRMPTARQLAPDFPGRNGFS